MNRLLYLLACAALLVLATPASLRAGDPAPAQVALKGTFDRVLACLTDKSISREQRDQKVRAEALQRFDNAAMAKLVLGSKNWDKLNAEQQVTFTNLFTDLVLHAYSKRLDDYQGETIEYVKTDVDEKGRAVVATLLVSNTGKMPVDYKMYAKKDGNWVVYDVNMEGVSLISTYRKQYDEYLAANPVSKFLEMVQEKVKEL